MFGNKEIVLYILDRVECCFGKSKDFIFYFEFVLNKVNVFYLLGDVDGVFVSCWVVVDWILKINYKCKIFVVLGNLVRMY